MRNDAANIFYEMKIFQDQDFWMIFADLPIFYLLGDNKQKFLILSVFQSKTLCLCVYLGNIWIKKPYISLKLCGEGMGG